MSKMGALVTKKNPYESEEEGELGSLKQVVVEPVKQTGVILDNQSKLKLDTAPHKNCLTLVDEENQPLIVSLDQFQQILKYVYVKERHDNMDHTFDLPKNCYKGVLNLSCQVNDEGVDVWDQDKPRDRIHLEWNTAKDICHPRGMIGAVI